MLGRDDLIANFDILLQRMSRGRSDQSMIITGLRGVGKTVLLGRFYRKALEQEWVVIESEVTKHDDEAFRRNIAGTMRAALFDLSPKARWTSRMSRAGAVLKSFSLSVDPSGG